jgi:hypothetical protein
VESFVECNKILSEEYKWVLPQLQAEFVDKVKPIKSGDKYCALETLSKIDDPFLRGLWYYTKASRRSTIISSKLYQEPNYGPLVPLLLNAYKKYLNIPYSRWKKDTLRYIVDNDLCDAMLYEPSEEILALPVDSWLDLRSWGLRFRTGNRAGEFRDPRSTATLYGTNTYEGFDVSGIPKFALILYTQIWCAHPANRSAEMVLDPLDWDRVPEPLISIEIFSSSKNLGAKKDIIPPWEL